MRKLVKILKIGLIGFGRWEPNLAISGPEQAIRGIKVIEQAEKLMKVGMAKK